MKSIVRIALYWTPQSDSLTSGSEIQLYSSKFRIKNQYFGIHHRTVLLWVQASDASITEVYDSLWYHLGRHEISEGKTDTYSVEGDNAELRHYLARLARSSRCFSRCPYARECALRLFVYCYNRRQLYKQRFPAYPAHINDFLDPLF